MIKRLLIGAIVLIAIFFVSGMFFYGFKQPSTPLTGGQQEQSSTSLILPIKKSDALTKYQGLWPFGIRGGDHPHGHPGIDFEIRVGAPILAAASGEVTGTGETPGGEREQKITIDIEAGQGKITIWYVGPMEILVKEGDAVMSGQTIAHAKASKQIGAGDVGFLHFETFRIMPFPPGAICPAEFLSSEAKADLEQFFKESKYKERNEFPLLCNACPPGIYPFGGCR